MLVLRWSLCLILLIWWVAAYPQGDISQKGNTGKTSWNEGLKGIPFGPFTLDIGGSTRLRYEHTSDFNIQRYADNRGNRYESGDFLIHRERLELNLRFNEEGRFFVQLQNNDILNSDFDDDDFFRGHPFTNSLDVRQAYLEWLHIADSPFGLRIGRQTIFYGDNRIWGPGEWGNTGRYTWDAVKIILDHPLTETHLIFGNRIRYDPDDFDQHDSSLDAYGVYSMIKNLPFTADLFWLAKDTRPDIVVNARGDTLDLDTQTFGLFLDKTPEIGWDWGGTIAYTLGDRSTALYTTTEDIPTVLTTKDDVRAYGYNARAGYRFDYTWKPRLGAQLTVGSGDSNPLQNGRYETFDGAFGAVDMPYGRMNLFSWMNIQDYELNLSIIPNKKMKVSLDYHFFRLDQSKDGWYYFNGQIQRRDPTGRSGRDLGREVDFVVIYKHDKFLEFQLGYAHFWPGSFIQNTGDCVSSIPCRR